jgi:V-type H+-transporting ATPase subunit a
MPMYKEVNPAIFACVSFPFLFGVMFGDMGHGSLMFTFGVILIFLNPYLKNTDYEMVGALRYLFTMMGFYAFYNGLIYNEVFAIPVEFFRSCYTQDAYTINASDSASAVAYH